MAEKPRGKRAKVPIDLTAKGRDRQQNGLPATRVRDLGCR